MKKRLLAVLMAATMLLGLTACGNDSKPAGGDVQSGGNTNTNTEANTNNGGGSSALIKVGIINNDPNESGYRTANDADMQRVFCADNGYEAKFAYSLKNEEQIASAQQFIQEGVDYLLLSPAGSDGWNTVLEDAKNAGIKVILFDRMLDADESLYEAAVVSDMRAEGETAANWLKDQNLSEYNIIHIQGVMGTDAQIGRSGALVDMAEAEGWNIVKQQTAEWNNEKADQIVQSVIDAGTDFNVIYAENDNMAQGAVAALDRAGKTHGVDGDVIIMGFDTNLWALEELEAGNWNYDGQCNPRMADQVNEIIQKLEKGESISPKKIIQQEKGFDAKTITADDVKNYGI